jgi:protocatechuate 3,4-dioxygenase beta subunit
MRPVSVVCAVGVIAALSAGSVGAATSHQTRCAPTPNDGGGPDRGTPPLRAKIGTGHVLTGVVLSPSCAPIAGALVSFWQSNARGVYTVAGSGAVETTKSGRFRFEGPRPRAYNGRPAHIHIKVEAPDFEVLFTEYEPRGARRGNVRLVLFPSKL